MHNSSDNVKIMIQYYLHETKAEHDRYLELTPRCHLQPPEHWLWKDEDGEIDGHVHADRGILLVRQVTAATARHRVPDVRDGMTLCHEHDEEGDAERDNHHEHPHRPFEEHGCFEDAPVQP